jgi:hypothetical protein
MGQSWVETEIASSGFPDQRLRRRLTEMMARMGAQPGASIPQAMQDWAATKGAYRFLSNPRITEATILAGHFAATAARVRDNKGPILVLHDTSEMNFHWKEPEALGRTQKPGLKGGLSPQLVQETLAHYSLALTPEGVPLGLCGAEFWSRDGFTVGGDVQFQKRSTKSPKKKESARWIRGVQSATQNLGVMEGPILHIGDQEADIYAFFVKTLEKENYFLVRLTVNRCTLEEESKLYTWLDKAEIKGKMTLTYHDGSERRTEKLSLQYGRVTIQPSKNPKGTKVRGLPVYVVRAHASSKRKRRDLDWKLITNVPILSLEDAKKAIELYALRWKIEVFFKILKSGLKVEELKLRAAEPLVKALAIASIVAWRIYWLTRTQRSKADVDSTPIKQRVLSKGKLDKGPKKKKDLKYSLLKVARLGGYLDRSNDSFPGNAVRWRGMEALCMIILGIELTAEVRGNKSSSCSRTTVTHETERRGS